MLHLRLLDKAAQYDMSALGKMESASTIYDRNKVTFGYIYEQKREPIPFSQIPVDLQHAVVSAEDNRFYTHNGSDFRGILRAALKNIRSGHTKTGSQHDHAATGPQHLPAQGTHLFPQDPRNLRGQSASRPR